MPTKRLLAAVAAIAWTSVAQAQSYRFQVYDAGRGLPSNGVYGLLQDAHGYMWFGTDGGAVRYDGVAATVLGLAEGLPDASVRAMVEDERGHVWIGTKGGLGRWDGQRFTTFTTAQGLGHDEVRSALRTRAGALWFGTARGVSRWDGQGFRSYGPAQGLPAVPVWALLEDRSGVLWAGMRGGGLARLEGERFVVYGRAQGLRDENVFGLAEDPQGGLWLATDGGLVRFDGRGFRHYTTADGLGSDRVSSVLVDDDGRVWAGTFGGGVSRLENGRFTVFNRRNGLPDDYVTAVLRDREGNMWFSSLWSGVFRLGSEQFTNYTRASGLPDGTIVGLGETPDGALWFASLDAGLARLDSSGQVRIFRESDGLLDERLWALAVDRRGRVWTGGPRGVSVWDGRAFRRITLEEMGGQDRINAIVEDGGGRMWFGSGAARSNGVIVYDGHSFQRFSTAHGLAHDQVNSFALDHAGDVWICTEDGLSRYDGRRFTSWRSTHGLPKRIMTAYEDEQGRLWVGTAEGLALFDGRGFRVWRGADGLPNDFVSAISSGAGLLWAGTGGGLASFDGTRFRRFTTSDGLASNQFSIAPALRRADGSVWFATAEGVTRFAPGHETTRGVPPAVHVTGLRGADGVPLPLAGPLLLGHRDGTLIFDFVGLSFTDESAVRYSTRLEGLDDEWSPPMETRWVRLIHLAPGRYRFLVRARSAAGVWSAPAALAFEVRPPLWATWWFRTLAAALLLGAAAALYAGRVRVLLRRHRERMESLHGLLASIEVINSNLALDTVLQNIAAESARLIHAQPVGIGLIRGQRVLFQHVWRDGGWREDRVELAVGAGVAGRVAAHGDAAVVNDPRQDLQEQLPEGLGEAPHGFMVLPIVDRQDNEVGILIVRRPEGRAPFGRHERQLLESLAHQAAVAIENGALYGELEEKLRNERQVTRMLQELNDMKSSFMVVTAHEMRTPLTILKGYHEVLRAGVLGPLSREQSESLAVCEKTTDRLIASFNDIVQMLEIDGGRLRIHARPVDVAVVLRELIGQMQPFTSQRGLDIALEGSPYPAMLPLDAEKMHIALMNLVENAIKFTPDGGRIRLRVGEEDGSVHIAVEDSGIGIDKDELERIFDKFYTSRDPLHHSSGTYQFRARGSGLGLSIAKGYVEAHGGRIWAESEGTGKGSAFHVVLPRGAAEAVLARVIGA